MKKGFSPFEIMIALAVGSLLGTALMQVLWQMGRSLEYVTKVSSADTRIITFQNLLEKELSGAFVPKLIPIDEQEEKKDTPPPAPKSLKQKEEKTITPPQAFYSQNNEDGSLKLLTFITVNSLVTYNVTKRRVARIMYTLRPDEKVMGAFALFRQEDSNIMHIKNFQERVKGFEVIGGIKSIRTEFFAYPEEPKSEKPAPDTTKKEKQPDKEKKELLRLAHWNVEKKENGDQDDSLQLPAIPQFIKMTIILVDDKEQEKKFESIFAPRYGIEPTLLEDSKPMQTKTQQQRSGEKLNKVMDDNPLSRSLQDKFSQWQPDQKMPKKGPPPVAPTGGPVTRGMEQ